MGSPKKDPDPFARNQSARSSFQMPMLYPVIVVSQYELGLGSHPHVEQPRLRLFVEEPLSIFIYTYIDTYIYILWMDAILHHKMKPWLKPLLVGTYRRNRLINQCF